MQQTPNSKGTLKKNSTLQKKVCMYKDALFDSETPYELKYILLVFEFF